MASTLKRITARYNADPFGWSETWFITTDETDQLYSKAKYAAATLLVARNNLFAKPASTTTDPPCTFLGATISDETILGDSTVLEPDTSYLGPPGSTIPIVVPSTPKQSFGGNGSEETDVAIRIRLEAGTLKRRIFMMRQLPSEICQDNVYLSLTATWRRFFNQWTSVLISNGFQLRVQDTNQQNVPLWSIGQTTGYSQNITISTVSPINVWQANTPPTPPSVVRPVQVNDRVLVRGVKQSRSVNGIWTVLSVIGPGGTPPVYAYFLGGKKGYASVNPGTAGNQTGRVRYVAYVGSGITLATDENGLWDRKTGKPLGGAAGRVKAR